MGARKRRDLLSTRKYAPRVVIVNRKNAESASVTDQRTGVELGVGQCCGASKREIEVRRRERDGDRNALKITLRFKRRYLGNRKSQQRETKSVLNGRPCRFLLYYSH